VATTAAAVACRQLYFPIVGALALSVIDQPWKRPFAQLLEPRRLTSAIAIGLPASVLMVIWATNWGGFVPPEFEARHAAELRIAGPVQALALAGLYAMFFAFPASELRKAFDTTTWRRIISISVVVALALWLVGAVPDCPDRTEALNRLCAATSQGPANWRASNPALVFVPPLSGP
jgi:hypothetical protein